MEYTNEQLTEAIELNLKGLTNVYKIAKKHYNNIVDSTEDFYVLRRASLSLTRISDAIVEVYDLLDKVETTKLKSERTLLRRTADQLLYKAFKRCDIVMEINLKCSKSK